MNSRFKRSFGLLMVLLISVAFGCGQNPSVKGDAPKSVPGLSAEQKAKNKAAAAAKAAKDAEAAKIAAEEKAAAAKKKAEDEKRKADAAKKKAEIERKAAEKAARDKAEAIRKQKDAERKAELAKEKSKAEAAKAKAEAAKAKADAEKAKADAEKAKADAEKAKADAAKAKRDAEIAKAKAAEEARKKREAEAAKAKADAEAAKAKRDAEIAKAKADAEKAKALAAKNKKGDKGDKGEDGKDGKDGLNSRCQADPRERSFRLRRNSNEELEAVRLTRLQEINSDHKAILDQIASGELTPYAGYVAPLMSTKNWNDLKNHAVYASKDKKVQARWRKSYRFNKIARLTLNEGSGNKDYVQNAMVFFKVPVKLPPKSKTTITSALLEVKVVKSNRDKKPETEFFGFLDTQIISGIRFNSWDFLANNNPEFNDPVNDYVSKQITNSLKRKESGKGTFTILVQLELDELLQGSKYKSAQEYLYRNAKDDKTALDIILPMVAGDDSRISGGELKVSYDENTCKDDDNSKGAE